MPAPRTTLTTGANSGIGLATVLELARRGHRSVGTVRSDAKADVVHRAAAEAGVTVETELLDVTDADGCAAVIDRVRPTALVNNAGYSNMGAVEDVPDEEVREQLEAMVVAPMRLARLALPHLRDAGGGHVIQVSSMMGRITMPLAGWYAATKHALEAVTDAFRIEVAADGVKVVLIEPGGFKTGIWEEGVADVDKRVGSRYDAAYRRSLSMTKAAGFAMGEPSQCAKVIAGAIESNRPRARYLVGADAATAVPAMNLAPTFLKDLVSRFSLGL